MRVVLDPKLLGDVKNAPFDFLSVLAVGETILTRAVSAIVYSGTDPSPSGLISGTAISGTTVNVTLAQGVVGVIYELLCSITTSLGYTHVMSAYLAVIPDLP